MNRKLPLDSHRQRELRDQPETRAADLSKLHAPRPEPEQPDCPNRTKFINEILAKKRGA